MKKKHLLLVLDSEINELFIFEHLRCYDFKIFLNLKSFLNVLQEFKKKSFVFLYVSII